ncbi:rho GTPase-activating protein 21 isoform X2 [Ooceraea biroi]|uniref:rho GTPase-activating protein 21 isoform X2 n=1 Tax=Ooceraea biroi TaxID=2015173 RepID=UPI0005BD53E5|nr:rho GTPase-activating protein 21 isoform X2 [Ooceraea biroi]
MADDRNNHRGFIRQPHGVRHSSPPPPAPGPGSGSSPSGSVQVSSRSVQKENSPPRGPRTLLLRRGENGYGFTLRHFIVYPPESCCMLPGHERTKIDEPMDTIFVKQVRANSPAAEAGLRTGDRVVSVDGTPTRGEQYSSVVQRIHQAGPWLRLLVVSKEDDILQRYFGETAYNPETNQRPRLRSPERLSQKQRRSISSMIPGPSPRTRQSWVCSLPSSESPNHHDEAICRSQQTAYADSRMAPSAMSADSPHCRAQIAQPLTESQIAALQQQRRGVTEASALYDSSDDPRISGRKLPLLHEDVQPSSATSSQIYSGRSSQDSRYDLYDRTRPESVYSRPSNEQIYDRINDPIYEHVRVNDHHPQHHYYQPSLLRYPVSQAEPQVPIYRPIKRMVTRRASEGSGTTNDSESTSYGSIDALRSNDSSRLSIESHRDSSPAASKDSVSPYDSNSTLTGNECSDDSVIMNRLRKSFEQKAEFLRRPSHPIGWSIEPSTLSSFNQAAVIQREFYARPQKLQRPVWPPGQNEHQQRQQSPTRRSSQERNVPAKPAASLLNKPSNQSVQRIKDVDSNSEYAKSRNDQQLGDNQSVSGDHSYSPLVYDNELAKEQYRSASKSSFVSTLSRIHENISTNQQQTQETRNGSSSLPSSPGPDKKAGDMKFPVPPQGLQIVSRRAKQFESGRLLSDEDEPAGDRTNLYKSELSRLSNKRSVPNVAVRKREFESKAESQEPRRIPARETKSLETDMPTMETESVRLRARSNSAESWEATNGPASRSSARHTWQTSEEDFAEKHSSSEDNSNVSPPVNGSSPNGSTNNAVVLRRQKNAQISDEDRATRRVSYLKATWGERMHVDSDLELSDSEPVHIHRSAHRRWRPPLFPSDITPLRRIFEDMTQAASLHRNSHHRNSIAVTHNTSNSCDGTVKDIEPVEREGTLHVKFTVLDGKRSTDRSWKQVWAVLRGPIIYFYKDRHSQSPSLSIENEANVGQSVDVRCSVVDVAEDYTKRKHVLRVANPTAEVLLQTEDAASMALWLRSLHSHAAAERSSDAVSCTSKQQAVPQTPTGSTTPNSGVLPSNNQRLSPLPSHKGIKKLTSFRNRSPTGQSPVNKTRKPSQVVEPLPSPKSKTWKGRVAKQFRRIGQAGGAPSSPTAQLPPEGATFKVPLELCPPSSFSECVPLIVEMCTSIVEARGLEVVGIYRVPGNTAAIAQLTDSVNRGFENINLQDPRWSDVNVISSLLKSFFRQLPDSLLTAELYPMFIDADKIEDPQRRMTTIRKLLRDLPEHHFETLKYLMQHLKKIVEHSEINKMEAKNLAIVFGPTLVRASGSRDNMMTMVTDMSHQCRIVESLLNNVDWFFSEDDLDDLSRLSVNLSLPIDSCEVEPTSNHSLLLNNIQKVEGMRDMASARDIVSSIISAANKKIQRRRKNQDEIDNSEHDNDKVKSKQDSESLPVIRQSMALNERQCSVSEIVQMHESKTQSNHSDRAEPRSLSLDTNTSNGSASNRAKYASQVMHALSAPSTVEPPRLSSEANLSSAETGSTVSSASNQTKQSNDEVAILTYTGLSATTQERVRRFEEETKAMLQRDQHRQRLEAEKREEERRRIEIEWQLAKREMENDDLLDSIVDTTVSSTLLSERLSGLNERLANDTSLMDLPERHSRSRSTARPPLSIAVQQQPTMHQKAQATSQLTSILGEKMNNGIIKKFKTDKDPSIESICLPPVRYGSLDSLHEVHNFSQSSPSPSQQQRGVPGDVSDDAGSCFLQWTQKILTINKKLSRHTASPGFWWYISSHLYGTAGPGSTTPKTPAQSPISVPVPVAAVPMPMSMHVSSTATASTAVVEPALAAAVASAAASASSPYHPGDARTSSSSSSTANNEPTAGLTAAKTLNRFLRGSDLLTSLTTTFDRKWRSLVSQSSSQTQPPPESTISNKNDITEQQKQKANVFPKFKYPSAETYRDPSLHKSLDKNHLSRLKDDAPEKDTDSTVTNDAPRALETVTPNNDKQSRLEAKSTSNHTTEKTVAEKRPDSSEKDEDQKDTDEGEACLHAGNAKRYELASEKSLQEGKSDINDIDTKPEDKGKGHHYEGGDSSYSNKLKKFESLTSSEVRSRLKRSESLNKRTSENTTSRLKRSESLNKHSTERLSPLKRSESLNKHSGDRSESPGSKLKRSESLTKTEKTECNISKRRQSVRKESATKLKRKNGMSERSIKRRHTVGGTKDFDKVHWLDNKLQSEAERIIKSDYRPKKSQLRTSSPDLSTNRVGMTDASFLIEVSFRGPSNVVFNVTNAARPQSLPDANLASKVFKVPLESHV